jgi:pyruvate/2-oxoglutarate dehydrogenase complex dihydrolipoamide acyltransferase (E2) component
MSETPPRFFPVADASSFRRIAASMWRGPADPSIHGVLDLDATAALAYVERFRAQTGRRLTVTHLVAAAVAEAIRRQPALNVKVGAMGRLLARDRVDLFVSVAADGGKDLSGVRIGGADAISLGGLVDAVERGARGVREGKDASYERSRSLFKRLPSFLLRPLLWLTDLLSNELHLHLPGIGMPRDPFGSAVITNVGGFGIDTAFAPLLPLGRCGLLILVSEVCPRPMVVDGQVVARPVLRLCGTFDHRIVDGAAAGVFAKNLRALLERPERLRCAETVEVPSCPPSITSSRSTATA